MNRIFLFSSFAVLLIIPFAINTEAVLWDLIILANIENKAIFPNDTPTISGQVVDQAGRHVENAKIHIRTGSDSLFTSSGDEGKFKVDLDQKQRIPGIYVVNIIAKSLEGKTGITTVEFQVKGELKPYSITEQKLSTPEAQKYLNSNLEDFEGDSIGITLYHYYQEILEKFLEQKKVSEKLSEEQLAIEEKRIIAKQSKKKTLDEFKPGPGVYSGFKYERYVKNLDSSVKGIITNQLNYTTNSFFEAQSIMNNILDNGGTYEEARKAYLERLNMPRDLLETMTINQTKPLNGNKTSFEKLNPTQDINSTDIEPNPETYSLDELMGKKGANVRTIGKSIFVDLNGTSIQFILNGTEFIHVKDTNYVIEYGCTLANNFLICPQEIKNNDRIRIEHGNRFTQCNALISNVIETTERRGTLSLWPDTIPGSEFICPASEIPGINYLISGKVSKNN